MLEGAGVTEYTVWGSYDGRRTMLKDLEDTHLANVINWVKKHEDLYPFMLLLVLRDIAATRGLQQEFLDRAEIPYKDGDNWMVSFKPVGKVTVSS